jgi:hypothetical protein
MTSEEAEDRLRGLLADAGVDLDTPTAGDVVKTWDVWRRFVLEPVEDVPSEPGDYADGILAQHGVYDWSYTGSSEFFELDMTRQFSFYEDDEYDHMAQLHCTFRFEPTDALRALGERNLWSFDMPLDDFFEQALSLPGFAGVDGLTPTRLDIGYSDV